MCQDRGGEPPKAASHGPWLPRLETEGTVRASTESREGSNALRNR